MDIAERIILETVGIKVTSFQVQVQRTKSNSIPKEIRPLVLGHRGRGLQMVIQPDPVSVPDRLVAEVITVTIDT